MVLGSRRVALGPWPVLSHGVRQVQRGSPLATASSCSEHSHEDSNPGCRALRWLVIRTA